MSSVTAPDAEAAPPEGRRSLAPLRSQVFRRLAVSYWVNDLGNWLGEVALAVLVFDRTNSALATAALFLSMRFLPALLGPLLTVRLEGWDGRRSLPLLYLAEAVAFAALALLAGGTFLLAAIVALAAVDGIAATAARALERGATAAALGEPGLLREGNAILNVGFTAGSALGPALAGVVVGLFGAEEALLADAASFVVIAILLAAGPSLPVAGEDGAGVLARLREGLAYVRRAPGIMGLLVGQAAALVFFTAVVPVEIVLVKETFGGSDTGYGLLLASWGAGMVGGGLLFAAARRARLLPLLVLSTVLIGVAYLGVAAAPTLAWACVASVLGGLGNGVQWVALVTELQEAIHRQALQARVMGLLEAINQLMPAIGFILGGAVATLASPRTVYALAGAGVLAIVAALVIVGAARGRRAPPGTPPPYSPEGSDSSAR
jgi:MFS family permease